MHDVRFPAVHVYWVLKKILPRAQSLKAAPGVDPDVLWMDHSEASCPGRRKRSKKKCPVCRTTLSIVNAFHCNLCAKDYCVKHRAQETHPCVESIQQVDTKKDEKSSGGDANTRASRKDRPKQDAPVGKSTLEFDDISAGLPSRVFVFNDDDDEDYGQRARLLNDKKRGKFSKMMLALSNLCSSKSQRRSQMRRRQSQFSPGAGADSVP
eukprot:GEMP01056007.1.p1 GENE.GEMP01056007.1~~GEMP01056007.1.p1  ORF type:complete len:209 (+),score=45.19 GEMP01056007.1:247-873(+)